MCDSGGGLGDREVRAGDLGLVHAGEADEMTARVDHCDRDRDPKVRGMSDRSSAHPLGQGQARSGDAVKQTYLLRHGGL
ncbi:hypothetical protein GCM10009858_41860 [Terrabacter carboxydivorans]|uniref:Uncharacterized protein n=2 Tax=Terrabacter carboxydivorans TaxID=619730 RepID=A0ABP5ZKJ2_9MICO